ncbi:MAG: hypothetical protein J6A21_08385, partial [Lentisphaeria bacterium]|nr:hypothetical protein [Lentisphaeria bacterium]
TMHSSALGSSQAAFAHSPPIPNPRTATFFMFRSFFLCIVESEEKNAYPIIYGKNRKYKGKKRGFFVRNKHFCEKGNDYF